MVCGKARERAKKVVEIVFNIIKVTLVRGIAFVIIKRENSILDLTVTHSGTVSTVELCSPWQKMYLAGD